MARPGRQITRNPLILVAGLLLIVSGVVGLVAFVLFLGGSPGAVEVLYLVVALPLAALSVYAGWLVLQQQERGRAFGLVLAIVGLVLAVITLFTGGGVLIVNLLINAFIVGVLMTQAKEFA